MNAKKILIFLIFIAGIGTALSNEQKEISNNKRWNELYKLVTGEIKTIMGVKNRKSRLQYRLFELYSEKLKLVREKENRIFLKASPVKVQKRGKKSYFKKTVKLYKKTGKLGLSIIKTWPKTRYKADIHYSLALNSRDYGLDNKTEKHLHLALRYAKNNAMIIHNTRVALAEFHYNGKRWKKALRFYGEILKTPKDEWHSKHLYNSAWCHYQTRNFRPAIRNMHRAFSFSRNKNYININDQILDFIGLFHVDGKDIKPGVEFYVKNTKDPGPYLIKMADKTAKNGQFDDTYHILDRALKESRSRKLRDTETSIRLKQIEVYRKYKKKSLHYETSVILSQMHKHSPIKKEHLQEAITIIKDYAGYLQMRLTKNAKKRVTEFKEKNLKRILEYFDILCVLDETNTDQYHYYQAETLYAVGKFPMAASYYKKAFVFTKKHDSRDSSNDKKKIKRKILDSLLATLAEGKISTAQTISYSEFTYTNYIKTWPRDKTSQKIYGRLFNLYKEKKKDLKNAVSTMFLYNKNYPEKIEEQKAMLTSIMDEHIKTKNTIKLSSWINKLNDGLFSFDKKYIDKATIILGQLLFEKIRKTEKTGKSKEAAKQYETIYDDDLYPRKIKAEAAFMASISRLDTGNVSESFSWLVKSFKHFTKKELFDLRSKILIISSQYYLYQDFKRASVASKMFISKFCKKEFKEKDDFIKNVIQTEFINGNYKRAILYFEKLERCNPTQKLISKTRKYILNRLVMTNNYEYFFHFYGKYKSDRSLTDIFYKAMLQFYWSAEKNNNTKLMKKISTIFRRSLKIVTDEPVPKPQISASIRAIFEYDEYRIWSMDFFKTRISVEKEFNEKKFNKELNHKVVLLKELEDRGIKLIKAGNSEVILRTYEIILRATTEFAKELGGFNPVGMPVEFVQSFKKAMNAFTLKLYSKIKIHRKSVTGIIRKNELLSDMNTLVSGDTQLQRVHGLHYKSANRVTPMDSMGGI
ncbi:MAG: hypothetical protein KAQ98_04010 [Bacteriovoracaceae bacterium]|nr:hypothetical protein [Bacteriovoracaceae bacterium]